MHRALLKQPLKWANKTLPANSYLVEDHNAAELLWHSRGFGSVEIQSRPKPLLALPGPGDTVLVVRVGGFGDLLWLNPIYARLREQGIKVIHCAFDRYLPVLDGFVDDTVSYPILENRLTDHWPVVWLENIIEETPCINGMHPHDRLASIFGMEPCEKKAAYIVTDQERDEAQARWPRTERPRVCVQVSTSSSHKDYAHLPLVLPILHKKGIEICVVGAPTPVKETVPRGIYDARIAGLTIRQSLAMMSQCDLVLAPDSVFIHAAHALDIPAVGIYGPFEGKTYMDGYKGEAIQGRKPCSPCSWHPRGTPFPPGAPCSTAGHCIATSEISPEFVAIVVARYLP